MYMKKFCSILILGGTVLLAGCASADTNTATPAAGDSYVALGSFIPKKGTRQPEDKKVDLQQMENERTMSNGTINNSSR
jgi:hypothetical protein